MKYRLTRDRKEYNVSFEVANGVDFLVATQTNNNTLQKNLYAEDFFDEQNKKVEGFWVYKSSYSQDQKAALIAFLKLIKEDKLEVVFENESKKATPDQLKNFYSALSLDFSEETIHTSSFVSSFPSFWPLSSRTKRILGFVGLGLLTAALITLTVLTAGAAAGVVGLAGAAGFVGVMSSITGLSTLALSTVSAFMALASLAMGGFIASVFAFGSTLRMGTLHEGEDFHNAPVPLKVWFRTLKPLTKVILALGFGLLALGLLALGGWAIASIVGILAVPAIVGPLLGGLATGFLGTLGGVTTLLGVGFASVTLSGVALKAAYDFSKQAKEDRADTVAPVKWNDHPALPNNSQLRGYLDEVFDELDFSTMKTNRSLFEELHDKLTAVASSKKFEKVA